MLIINFTIFLVICDGKPNQYASTNRDDIIEQWLNESDSDEDEIGRNSPTSRNNATTTHSENEYSDNKEEFVIKSDHDSSSELSESEDTLPKWRSGYTDQFYWIFLRKK